MRLLRELSRRKLRTVLTITGITIGIWALVVFSSSRRAMASGSPIDPGGPVVRRARRSTRGQRATLVNGVGAAPVHDEGSHAV
jgi:hypothetical protein